MKKTISIALLVIIVSSCSKKEEEAIPIPSMKLTISSTIDKETQLNQEIIKSLTRFLETKNNSHYKNEYWSQSDFKTFYFPYLDIYNIENKDSVLNFYQPTLMEIVNTNEDKKKLIKLAFIGHDESTKENIIKSIYNIVATKSENRIVFSNPLHYLTNAWTKVKNGDIQYVVSPQKQFNEEEAKMQRVDISRICKFYNTDPLLITYYSCIDAKELFQIKGFDYNPMMYVGSGGGGLSSHHNIIFSANNSEFYTHEILHLYNVALFPSIPKLINEGMATYVGGSRTYNYTWHKENLKKHVETMEIDFSKHLEPFERFYVGEETPIPYMIGALICERTYRIYGKEKLLTLLSGESEFWELLFDVGLTKENIDTELKKELLLPPTLCMIS